MTILLAVVFAFLFGYALAPTMEPTLRCGYCRDGAAMETGDRLLLAISGCEGRTAAFTV